MKLKISELNNTVWIGLLIGFVVPILPLLFAWWLMLNVSVLAKADLLLIGCVALNALLMNYFFKKNKDNIARGIISITFLWAFAFFFYKVG
jgi:hypothetical protein